MIKGDAPFDIAAVQASLKTFEETAAKAKTVFPDDSKTGETDTLPVAFEKKADLLARFDKMGADAKAAHATIKDEASFKAEWPKVAAHSAAATRSIASPSNEFTRGRDGESARVGSSHAPLPLAAGRSHPCSLGILAV